MDNASSEDPGGELHGDTTLTEVQVPLCTAPRPQEGAPEEEEILDKTDQRKFKKKIVKGKRRPSAGSSFLLVQSSGGASQGMLPAVIAVW